MSSISISGDSIQSIAMNNMASAADSAQATSHTVMSNADNRDVDTSNISVVGTETVSRTQDYIGSGPDLTSTGTDPDFKHMLSSALMSGTGSIADKII